MLKQKIKDATILCEKRTLLKQTYPTLNEEDFVKSRGYGGL